MKTIKLFIAFLILVVSNTFAQENHVQMIYDIEGNDMEKPINYIVGAKDSLFIIANTPNNHGIFYRIDENGKGYKTIWEFDSINAQPFSLIISDSSIFGTTRFSKENGGSIFEYSLKNNTFKIIKEFSYLDVQDIKLKYINDTAFWLTSNQSANDFGSVFYVNKKSGEFNKILSIKDKSQGSHPEDMLMTNDTIYLALGGGGKLFPNGDNTYTESGAICRLKTDGSDLKTLILGNDTIGSHPYSIVLKDKKLYGMFSYLGTKSEGQFFSTDLDGSNYKHIGGVSDRVITNMLESDSLIYGFSTYEIFGIDPYSGEHRIFDQLESNPDFGFDISSNATYLNGNVYFATQQGGINQGGAILKWSNNKPIITPVNSGDRIKRTPLDLNKLFTDPEKDSLTFNVVYDKNQVSVLLENDIATFTPLTENEINVTIIANDGWSGYNRYDYTINKKSVTANLDDLTHNEQSIIYPNPTNGIISINTENIKSIEVYSLNGELIESFFPSNNQIDLNKIINGMYFLKINTIDKSIIQKISKE